MMKFTHNDWGKLDITKNNIFLTKSCADKIYTVSPTKYQMNASTTILNSANVMTKVNKLPDKHLLNMKP